MPSDGHASGGLLGGSVLSAGTTGGGLVVEGLTVKRGGLTICHDVSFEAPAGEITVLLGANGAGKTTLLDGIAGVLPTSGGAVSLGGQRIDAWPVHRRAAAGLGSVEQGRAVFAGLTVEQNLAVVSGSRTSLERAYALFPRLGERRDVRAGLLSGGEAQMLLIARALAARPRVLLIDELSLGLAPAVVRMLLDVLADLASQGMAVLLVEQFAELALRVGTTAHVLEWGRIVRSAPCGVLLRGADA